MKMMRRALPTIVLWFFPVFVLLILVGAIIGAVLISKSVGGGAVIIVKILVFPVIAAIWYGIKEVKAMQVAPAEGIELTRAQHPALWNEVERLAVAAQTAPPERIVVVPEVNASVSEATGGREMTIGLPLLSSMSVGELRSVLAHELGHFAGGDTARGARIMRRVYALDALRVNAGFITRRFLQAYSRLYAMAAGPVSRDMERAADQVALTVAGAKVSADAMRTMARLDGAWSLLGQRFVGLFPLAGKRASLAEGLSHLVAANSDELEQFADAALSQTRTRSVMTHPPLGERIATFEAAHAQGEGAVSFEGVQRPAAELIGGGTAWLAEHEGGLLRDPFPLTSWDELVAEAGRASLNADAARYSAVLVARGVGAGSLHDVLTLLQTPDLAPENRLGPVLTGADDDQANNVAGEVVWALVTQALIDGGHAHFEPRWDGPAQLVSGEGEPIDPTDLIEKALASPADAEHLRTWLTERGVNMQVVAQAPAVHPEWCAAMSNVSGPWDGRADVHVWTTGLLVIPVAAEVAKADKRRRSNEVQKQRLYAASRRGLDACLAESEATWTSVSDVTSARVVSRVRLSIAMELVDGGSLAFKSSTDTEMVPSPREFGEAFGSIFPIAPS
jgi:Zn-dependent protease with chaperone function